MSMGWIIFLADVPDLEVPDVEVPNLDPSKFGWLAFLSDRRFQFFLVIGLTVLLAFLASKLIPKINFSNAPNLLPKDTLAFYQAVIQPTNGWLLIVFALAVLDLAVIFSPGSLALLELPFSLALAATASWAGFRIFARYFDVYLLDLAFKSGRKVNSELLILAKFFANTTILVIAIIAFAQTHQINIIGLLASLGVGGLAVAFAAQKTLEQLLGGIVIYVDKPFVVDDYVGLPDGTFGRVEAIGLRSTKIRSSGKGTVVVVPNSGLTQMTIENFTGAKKVMAIAYLDFYRAVPEEEQALIKQVIRSSTQDIFGIDSRSTDVAFRQLAEGEDRAQAQVTFFILGSGDVSMDLRRQLLDIANQSITQRLKEYGIAFDLEEPTIYVDSPITV